MHFDVAGTMSTGFDAKMKRLLFFGLMLTTLPRLLCAQTELFDFGGFEPAPELSLQGSAAFVEGKVRLTPSVPGKSGGVWHPTKRLLQEGFETTFSFQLGSGSEGIAFVVQNNVLPALGRGGSGLGFEGVPNSIAVEFDMQSSADIVDLPDAHVSVQTRGATANNAYVAASIASKTVARLADGNVHTARIRYTPGTLTVFLDHSNVPAVTAPVVLPDLFPLENGQAWFGIVAANGTGGATHDVLTWTFELATPPLNVALVSPLEGGSFLAPSTITIEATATGPDPVTTVEFFQGTQRLFTGTNAPYQYRWDSMLPGAYTITAVATDAAGRKITSQPVRVVVYPSAPLIGVNFMTSPGGSNYALTASDRAGIIPQHHWNNAPMATNGNGTLQNLRNAAGEITAVDVTYDFVVRGEEALLNPDLGADYRLMRAYGANVIGTTQTNTTLTISSIPFAIYDLIIYTDGGNGGADRVSQFRNAGNSIFLRDAAWTTFAGIYASGGGGSDQAKATPAGNYIRINGLTTTSVTLTNNARSASDGFPLSAINAIQIVPSVYDKNTPPFLTRGPYLQTGTPQSMTVRWRSNRPVTGRVQFGTNAADLNLSSQEAADTQEHTVVLTNLVPNTRYFYAVGTDQTNLVRGTNLFFWTSPTAPKPTRIWAIGDAGTVNLGNAGQAAVRDAFNTLNGSRYIDVWLMLGDNAYNSGTDAEYQGAVFQMYTNWLPQSPVWPTLGNHETAQSHTPVATTPYLAIFNLPQNGEAGGIPSGTERYYSFDYGDIHFICLDAMTNDRSDEGPMANWLRSDLEANAKKWLVAFWHHPPYTKGSHDSDNPNGADFELVEMRENINPILEAHGVDIVLSGHSHCYERSFLLKGHYGYSTDLEPSMILNSGGGDPSTPDGAYRKTSDGTIYIVDGSSGQATFGTMDHPAHYKSILQLGSVIIDVDGNELVARFLRETGEVQDTFTIIKQPGTAGATIVQIKSISAENGRVTLSWNSLPGTQYIVERAANLSGPWQAVSGELTAQGQTHSWTYSNAEQPEASFFRVVTID
jgi:hypothetical protein